MGKKFYFGSDNIISIYKLMEICGLDCPVRGNIAVSHKIALRKLNLRSIEKPGTVTVPTLLPFRAITNEAVRTGKILLVRDDCKNVCAYLRPVAYLESQSVSKVFDDLFHCDEAYDFEEELETNEGVFEKYEEERIKPGEKKYLLRHQRKSSMKVPKIDDLSPKEKEKRRKKLLKEFLNEEERIKPGEEKYKRKKLRKEGC